MKDQILLLLTGIVCAAMAWAFFHYLGESSYYVLFVIVIYGMGADLRRLRKENARLRKKVGE
jgi:hypothetical protein